MPRYIPKGLGVKIKKEDIKILPIFKLIQKVGGIGDEGLSLYETVRTRAYSLKFTVGTSGAIMYIAKQQNV